MLKPIVANLSKFALNLGLRGRVPEPLRSQLIRETLTRIDKALLKRDPEFWEKSDTWLKEELASRGYLDDYEKLIQEVERNFSPSILQAKLREKIQEKLPEPLQEKAEKIIDKVDDIKEKVDDIQDKIQDRIQDRVEDIQDKLQDKAEDIRENIRENIRETIRENIREKIKDKAEELREKHLTPGKPAPKELNPSTAATPPATSPATPPANTSTTPPTPPQ